MTARLLEWAPYSRITSRLIKFFELVYEGFDDKVLPRINGCALKSHPFGNEDHFITDWDHGKPLIWRVKLVEEKNGPVQLGKFKLAKNGEIVGLMLQMIESFLNSGRVVVMDSGFFLWKNSWI